MGSFKDVVGHKDIIKYIRNAVNEEDVYKRQITANFGSR